MDIILDYYKEYHRMHPPSYVDKFKFKNILDEVKSYINKIEIKNKNMKKEL